MDASGGQVATTAPDYAGFWQRGLAWLIDSLIVSAIAFVPIIPLLVWASTLSEEQQTWDIPVVTWLAYVLVSMLTWIVYQVVMTARGGGWGKRLLGIRVVRVDNGDLPGIRKAAGRVLFPVGLGVVPFGSILNLGNLLAMIPHERKQTWHDRVSGTVVVRVARG